MIAPICRVCSWCRRRCPNRTRTAAILLLLASFFLTAAAPPLHAQDTDLRNLSVVRFDFDNDVFLGKDNSFTAGWSLQVPSPFVNVLGPRFPEGVRRRPVGGDARGVVAESA